MEDLGRALPPCTESPVCLTCFILFFMESCGCCIPSMWGMPGGQPGYCWDTILNKLSSWSEEMDHVSAVRLLGSPEASRGKAGLALLRDHVVFLKTNESCKK